jgi:hypothetical protein
MHRDKENYYLYNYNAQRALAGARVYQIENSGT